MLDINAVWFPEISRLSDLAGKLEFLTTDMPLSMLAKQVLAWLGAMKISGTEEMPQEMVVMCVLQMGYIAGIEAYEREYPVNTEAT